MCPLDTNLQNFVFGCLLRVLTVAASMRHMQQQKLATRKEAAFALNVSVRTIHRMLKAGQISFVRIRGAVRIPLEVIEKLAGVAA